MDALARHEASTTHREAVEQERACQIVKCRGGIREAIEGQVVLQRNAVAGAIKCLYWLCKREKAHTTNFKPLLSLATSLGCTCLSTLNVVCIQWYRQFQHPYHTHIGIYVTIIHAKTNHKSAQKYF